ncbi:DUF4397 domain-containing protein [Clostridium carnis]
MILFRENLPNLQSKIRFLHSLPSSLQVDIYANGELIGKDLSFSKITCYKTISPGSYKIEIFNSGTYDSPILAKNIDLLPNTSSTISLITLGNDIDIFVLNDANIPETITNSFLRFIHLSPNAPLLTLSLPNDISLFGNVEYVETTGYYPLSPAIYNFKVLFLPSNTFKYIKDITLKNGKFYTIYIIGSLNASPQLGYLLVEDGNQ